MPDYAVTYEWDEENGDSEVMVVFDVASAVEARKEARYSLDLARAPYCITEIVPC